MTREEVLERYQNQLINSSEELEILSDIFLESDNPKELVDKSYRRSIYNNLSNLKDEVYDLPVEGYKNLYDYICSLAYIDKVEVSDTYRKRQDYIDITLKRLGLFGLTIPINSKLLYRINPETGKTVIDEFLDQLRVIIDDEECDLVHIDSLRLAKDLYIKGLIRALRYCDDDLYDQIIDEKNNRTILDILAENNYIYGLPILGVEWNNYNSYKYECHLLDKFIRSLNKTVLEYLLDNNYLKCFNYYKYEKNLDYWKKILRLTLSINRLDLLSAIPCEFLKWPINKEDPNSIDYYTLLKNNSIKYEGYDEFNDTRVAYDYLMEPSANLEYFIKKCSFNIFKSKYKEGSNETIATLFFSILSTKSTEEQDFIIMILDRRKWLDEEIICAASYNGITLNDSNRSFYDMYLGLNSNHALDYAIYDDGLKEKHESSTDYLSIEFIRVYEKDSDENTLYAILTSYFAYKETNPIEAQKELKLLIDIKNNNPNFIIQSSILGSEVLYDYSSKYMKIANCFDYNTLNHELAHILFNNISDDDIKDLEVLLSNIKDDKVINTCYQVGLYIFNSISTFSKKKSYKSEFVEYIESRFGSIENYKDIMREEYKVWIGDYKILADYIFNNGYYAKTAEILGKAIYENRERYLEEWAIKTYVTERYLSEELEFVNKKLVNHYRELLIYENFMDAYYGGLLNTIYKTRIKNRTHYLKSSTHSENYFRNNRSRIEEMFANFVELKKLAARKDDQPDSIYYLDMIRKSCGEEVYNGLELLYKKALDKIQLDEEITIQDSKRV